MPQGQRIALFSIYLIAIGIISSMHNGVIFPQENSMIVLYTSLIMLAFIMLFVEHFFSKPTDVLSSSLSILLLLAPVENDLSKFGCWYSGFFYYNIALVLLSLIALLILNKEVSPDSTRNKISNHIKKFVTAFGNGKFLFFTLFILSLLFYVDNQSKEFLFLFGFSVIVLLVDPKKYYFNGFKKAVEDFEVGNIFGVQSANTFLVKIYENKPLAKGDYLQFGFNEGHGLKQFISVVIDVYILDGQRWGKILKLENIDKDLYSIEGARENTVIRIDLAGKQVSQNLIGTVVESSNIRKIRFEETQTGSVEEGSLIELEKNGKSVLYQVLQGTTYTKSLESRNEAAGITGEAIQLGYWNHKNHCFDQYGWVPTINDPLFIARNIDQVATPDGYMEVGRIPNTNYPIFMNLKTAVSHHLAILGVTGTGKSVFTRNIIRTLAHHDVKVIIVDFTLEHSKKLNDVSPNPVVTEDKQKEIFSAIDKLSEENDKYPNQRNQNEIRTAEKTIKINFYNAIKEFFEGDETIRLFELPDVSNSTAILEYTKWFFKALFAIARNENNFGNRVSVVLEEAHTVIPEWNFVGVSDKSAQSLVNSIGQIALQGRKYNIGFIIVAQRTANVSKTVLTQCNSIIAFQQFDRTSGEFLSNYVGEEMTRSLPSLRFRQGIAVGKAFKANTPLIFEVPEISEASEQTAANKSIQPTAFGGG